MPEERGLFRSAPYDLSGCLGGKGDSSPHYRLCVFWNLQGPTQPADHLAPGQSSPGPALTLTRPFSSQKYE